MEPLVVSGKLDSLSAIAQYVLAAASAAGLDKKAGYKLRLAIDEVATNIVMHGYDEAGLEGDITIKAEISPQRLTISLEDRAIPYDPTCHQEPDCLDLPLQERQIGGLGVFLALDGVDQFDYEFIGGCNRNIFTINLGAST
ncbi:MAG: anti-sigma regulatory factor [Pseudanabaenaceae cyanobacterium bins.68]|nr:anti-sigma regulatory factor [Pseudanabaenaceae cyanobacterium bins.68]